MCLCVLVLGTQHAITVGKLMSFRPKRFSCIIVLKNFSLNFLCRLLLECLLV